MKKQLFSLLCVLSLLVGCGTQVPADAPADAGTESAPPATVRTVALKGPTAMGMVQFMDEAPNMKENDYQFSIVNSPDEVVPQIIKGEVDIAAVPANLASVLYTKTKGEVEVLGINTLGVLYIVENGNTIQSVQDLKGKTIYASGKNAVPEYVLRYVLKGNQIDPDKDVKIEWKAQHSECVHAITEKEGETNPNAVALLPQPFATVAEMKGERDKFFQNMRIALDLGDLWNALQINSKNPSTLITGVVVARRSFVNEHPEAVQSFLARYADSVTFVNENIDDAAKLVAKYDITFEPIARKAIPLCKIVLIQGEEMKTVLPNYLQVLFEQDPKSVGGALPGEDFYYQS